MTAISMSSSSLECEAVDRLNGGDYTVHGLTKVVNLYVGEFPDGDWHLFVFRASDGAKLRHFWGATEYNTSHPTWMDVARQWATNWCQVGTELVCSEEELTALRRKENYILKEARPSSFSEGASKRAAWKRIYEARKRFRGIKDPTHKLLWLRHGFDYTPGASKAIWYY